MNIRQGYWLYLDDWRTPQQSFTDTMNPIYNYDRWKMVRNYAHFVRFIERGVSVHLNWPEVVSLDHDLTDAHFHQCVENPIDYDTVQETGWHALRWLIDYSKAEGLPMPKVLIHSANYHGRENMFALLKAHGIPHQ